jgi:hypothetical protein
MKPMMIWLIFTMGDGLRREILFDGVTACLAN